MARRVCLVVLLLALCCTAEMEKLGSTAKCSREHFDHALKDTLHKLPPAVQEQKQAAHKEVHRMCEAIPWGEDGRPVLPKWFAELPAVRLVRNMPEASAVVLRAVLVLARATHGIGAKLSPRAEPKGDLATSMLEIDTPEEGDPSVGGARQYYIVGADDRPYWEERDFRMFGPAADTVSINSSCYLAYVSSYVASWLASMAFFAVVNIYGERVASQKSSEALIANKTGWFAFFLSLFFAMVASGCTTRIEGSATPCFSRSRKAFNFLWPALLMMGLGSITVYIPQAEDLELENFLRQRQKDRHKLLEATGALSENRDSFSAERKIMALTEGSQQYAEATKDASASQEGSASVTLKSLQQFPGSGLFSRPNMVLFFGAAFAFVVLYLIVTSCSFDSTDMSLRGVGKNVNGNTRLF